MGRAELCNPKLGCEHLTRRCLSNTLHLLQNKMLLLRSGARATGAGRDFTANSGAAMWLPSENRILVKTAGAH